jgi:N-acetylneuraminic acid mutarotase
MPRAGACGTQGVINNLLYVNTGCGQFADPSQFYRYNPATNLWSTLPPPPVRHDYGVGEVIGGKFYLAGGEFGPQLHVYNPATNNWATKAPVPQNLPMMSGAVLNGRLLAAGGFDGPAEPSVDVRTLRVYNPATNTWAIRAPMPTPRSTAAGAAAGGKFFVIGGFENNDITRKVVAYTP